MAVNNNIVARIIGMALVSSISLSLNCLQGCLGTTNRRNPDLC